MEILVEELEVIAKMGEWNKVFSKCLKVHYNLQLEPPPQFNH